MPVWFPAALTFAIQPLSFFCSRFAKQKSVSMMIGLIHDSLDPPVRNEPHEGDRSVNAARYPWSQERYSNPDAVEHRRKLAFPIFADGRRQFRIAPALLGNDEALQ